MESTELSLLDPTVHAQKSTTDVPFLYRKRYFVTIMVFLGIFFTCILQKNLSIAIVDMTIDRNITDGNRVYLKKAEFKWTQFENDFLLGCPSALGTFGCVGGFLSCKFGGTRVFGVTLLLNGILAFFTPIFVNFGVPFFAIIRMLGGFFCAISFISVTQIFMKWAPMSEKFRLIQYSMSGIFFGLIAVFPLCGFILENFEWHYVFYFTGSITMLWYVIWATFIYNEPLTDNCITEDEQRFIVQNLGVETNTIDVYPWRKIFTSKAVLAYLNERFVEAWSFSFAVDCLPSFINDAFHISISQIGLISSVPNICNLIGYIAAAQVADFILGRKISTPPIFYIGLITISQITCTILLTVIGLSSNLMVSLLCICLLRFTYGWAGSTYSVLPLDIAGEYASIVVGLGSSIFNIGMLLNPLFTSFIVPNRNFGEWSRYFLFLSALNVWGATIFYFYGSGRPEPWTAAGKKTDFKKNPRMVTKNDPR